METLLNKLQQAGVQEFKEHYQIYYGRKSPTENKLQLIKELKKLLTVKEVSIYFCLLEYFSNEELDYILAYLRENPLFSDEQHDLLINFSNLKL